MGYIARGLYRELLDEQFLEGSLPSNLEALAEICGCSVKVMEREWPSIAPCFEKQGDRLVNPKIENVRTERDKLRVKRADSGRLGGKAKHSLANAKQMPVRREEKSREEKRTSVKRIQPVEDKEGMSPDMVASAVLDDLRLSGTELRMQLEAQCRMEMQGGLSAEEIRSAMVAAWREYEGAKPRLQFVYGASKFFGEIWRNQSVWPWKDGERKGPVVRPPEEPVHEFQSRSIPMSEIRKGLGKGVVQ